MAVIAVPDLPVVTSLASPATLVVQPAGGETAQITLANLVASLTSLLSINTSQLVGSITASQIGSVSGSTLLAGSITASQIGSISGSTLLAGSITASQIASVSASSMFIGLLNSSQVASISASAIQVGLINAGQISTIAASTITIGVLHASQISTIAASTISVGVLVTSQLAAQIISSAQYLGSNLRAVYVRSTLPTLPNADFPVDSLVLCTTDVGAGASRLYTNTAGTWVLAPPSSTLTGRISQGDILSVNATTINGFITAGSINAVNASAINGTLTASQIATISATQLTGEIQASQINLINATQIVGSIAGVNISNISATAITAGSIEASQINSVSATNITVGAINAARITVVNASTLTGNIDVARITAVNASTLTGNISAGIINSVNAAALTGTINAGIINSLVASNITLTGTWDNAQIGSMNVSKLTAGTFSAGTIVLASSGAIQSSNFEAGVSGFSLTSTSLLIGNGTFYGTVVATAGNIGGFTISASGLSAGSGGTVVNLYANAGAGGGLYLRGAGAGLAVATTWTSDAASYLHLNYGSVTGIGMSTDASGGLIYVRNSSGAATLYLNGANGWIGFSNGVVAATNLYCSAATTLKTDGSLTVVGTLTVGTFSPTSISASASISAGTTITATGSITGASFNTSSAGYLKTNISPLRGALGLVEALQGCRFDWRSRPLTNDFGLIAEEVAKVLPTAVGYDGEGRPASVDYGRLTTVLIESVKDLAGQVRTLKQEMARR